MLDHLLGRPSASFKRSQVVLVLGFWLAVVVRSPRDGPRALYLRKLSRLLQRFTPWQIVCATLTAVYALRHIADLVGLGSPEPLSRLYSRAYYRATWVATAFDAGLATAMPIRPKWVRDLAGFLFAGYYLIYANEADEKLRKFRSTATVEMLRTTWEKPLNPYVRLITRPYRPSLPVVRTLLVPRPAAGPRASLPPVRVVLFFDGPPAELALVDELILDFPGGGFICMGPGCHEERLRFWARRFGRGRSSSPGSSGPRRAVVSVDYGKSPEYPYPWAIEECFDLYLAVVQSNGAVLGLGPADEGRQIELVLTGDSAGANIVCTVLFSLLENPLGKGVRRPKAIVLAYAALDFNFTSWMSQENLRVLREETGVKRRTASGVDLSGLEEAKDHLAHRSPLAVVHDLPPRRAPSTGRLVRTKSWSQMFGFGALVSPRTPTDGPADGRSSSATTTAGDESLRHRRTRSVATPGSGSIGPLDTAWSTTTTTMTVAASGSSDGDLQSVAAADEGDDDRAEEWKTLRERVRTPQQARSSFSLAAASDGRHARSAEQDPFDRPLSSSAADRKSSSAPEEEGVEGVEGEVAQVGTRLTMTSRSGYFQDRIITPSMMRAMAILYIGPSQNPDLSTDYYISPLLAPARLLADFPPVLLVCGEKDPFVDDTVVMAGRIREARAQAAGRAIDDAGRDDDNDDEWVRMEIMEGWGHGYLQMVALMPEIKGVLEDIAQYMDDAFTGALFPGSTATTTGTSSPSHPAASTTANPDVRSWIGRLLGWRSSAPPSTAVDRAELDLVETSTPVTPPPSVNASPPSGRSRSTTTSGGSAPDSAPLRATAASIDDDGEMLAFTPKRLRSPPLRAVPRHGILKKPPPSSIILPPPFTPPLSCESDTPPSAAAAMESSAPAGHAGLHVQPNAKTLPSLLAAALTRSLTPPSGSATGGHHAPSLSSTAGTPHSHPASAGSFASTPIGGSSAPKSVLSGAGGGASGKQRPLAIDERELMRRRRVDAVFGMELGGGGSGGTASASGAGGAEDSSQEGAAEAEDGMADLLL